MVSWRGRCSIRLYRSQGRNDHRIVRTTISLPDPLFENAKRLAAERRITVSALVEDALRQLSSRKPASSAPPFRLHTVRGKLVNPNLDLHRTSALVVAEDEAAFRHDRR